MVTRVIGGINAASAAVCGFPRGRVSFCGAQLCLSRLRRVLFRISAGESRRGNAARVMSQWLLASWRNLDLCTWHDTRTCMQLQFAVRAGWGLLHLCAWP